MSSYTEDANKFIEDELAAKKGIDKKDIFSHFVTKGKQVIWPEIGDDGKAHLVKKVFK